jgi:putative membrane protein
MTGTRKPFVQELEDEADPGAAPPVPDLLPVGQAMQRVMALTTPRSSPFWRFAVWAFGALFTFVLSVAAWDFVTGLFARNSILGWAAFLLISGAVIAALILALKEWAAFARLARLDGLRQQAAEAREGGDLARARAVVASLVRLYGARSDTAWGRARLEERRDDVLDADAVLALAETELLGPLDVQARAAVESAARQVAIVTALVPMALADVATALFTNLRMIRRIAEIYGGRSGSFGSLKLLRKVFSSLVATGAVALTDDLIGSVAGGGVLSKVSRRFGEGVVNGALTARVGVAAMEICRPMPFVAREKPGVTGLVSSALKGTFARG